jgi:circadian clock protein KaiB
VGDSEPLIEPEGKSSNSGPPSKFHLKLYVAGTDSRTQSAIANLQRICESELAGQYDLEVIDVLERPDEAEEARILATPTLIKQLPPPLRRVIGDLSDKQKLLLGLEIRPTPAPPNGEGKAK